MVTSLDRRGYLDRAVVGGFPEVVNRPEARRRAAWFVGYARTLAQRDVREIAAIERGGDLSRLLRLVEVDIVLESPDGRVVGIEVKAASTVRAGDFVGLRHLAERVGGPFRAGLVLDTGRESVPFGDHMWCTPISALWQV